MSKIVKCAVCGRELPHGTNLPYRYCSAECRAIGVRKYQREYRERYRQNAENSEREKARERKRQQLVRDKISIERRRKTAVEILELAKNDNAVDLIAQYLNDTFKYKRLD